MALPTETLDRRLNRALARRRAERRERRRRPLEPLPGMRVRTDGAVLHNFCSNDYLGLASARPDTSQLAGCTGSGASALVSGYQPSHEALERELAEWLGREAAVLTTSGFLANLAVLTALAGRSDTVAQDRLCHASLIDAARLSGATLVRYPHADQSAARERLESGKGHRLLVTDGVFSMDGDVAPVRALAGDCRALGATFVVDDAHGIGVLGPTGAGLCEAEGLGAEDVPVLVGTLGKAFGAGGAFIAGSRALIEHLENHARSIIYSTALSPVLVEASRAALTHIREDRGLRARLRGHIDRFRSGAGERGIPLSASDTPIQPLVVGGEDEALAWSSALENRGYLVTAIRPPTVPAGTSRLRITLSAGHDERQIDGLLDALASVRDECPMSDVTIT